jgi:HEAT repeat protein
MLSDEAPWVRSEAVLALGRIGTKEDVPRIAVLLRDPDRKVRVGAALALGELGFAEAGEFLGAPAKDPDRLLRLASTLSLARLGKVGVAAFRSALKEVATDDLAFACLGTAALEAAAFS